MEVREGKGRREAMAMLLLPLLLLELSSSLFVLYMACNSRQPPRVCACVWMYHDTVWLAGLFHHAGVRLN